MNLVFVGVYILFFLIILSLSMKILMPLLKQFKEAKEALIQKKQERKEAWKKI